jgi:hypothetical protein
MFIKITIVAAGLLGSETQPPNTARTATAKRSGF